MVNDTLTFDEKNSFRNISVSKAISVLYFAARLFNFLKIALDTLIQTTLEKFTERPHHYNRNNRQNKLQRACEQLAQIVANIANK